MAQHSQKDLSPVEAQPPSHSLPSHRVPAPRFVAHYPKEDLQVIHRNAAGIDLAGRGAHFIALEISETELEVIEVGGMTPDMTVWVEYLKSHAVTTVAMEATGVYWIPVFDALEKAGIEVFLVNPSHAKNVPGRPKDDKLDARWLQKLHKFGLLAASFRPSEDIRPLQEFWHQRSKQVEFCGDAVRRQQRALDMMNLRPHQVISDLDGVTGQRIVDAIVNGERDPVKLASYRDHRCHCTDEELYAALTGYYQPHLVFALEIARKDHLFHQAQIAQIDAQILQHLTAIMPENDDEITEAVSLETHPVNQGKHPPPFNAGAMVTLFLGVDPTQLPGIGGLTALGLLSMLGYDMDKWKTDRHFGSYLGLAPVQKISGGKRLSSRTRPGIHPAAVLFLQSAVATIRSDNAYGAFYRRLAARISKPKALYATAYKIAKMYYHLLKDGQEYVELGVQDNEARYHAHQVAAMRKRAKKLGFDLIEAV